MPWKGCSVMDERLRFVARLLDGETMTDVCREFGISRKPGYKISDRYKEHGLAVLSDRSRRPTPSSKATIGFYRDGIRLRSGRTRASKAPRIGPRTPRRVSRGASRIILLRAQSARELPGAMMFDSFFTSPWFAAT